MASFRARISLEGDATASSRRIFVETPELDDREVSGTSSPVIDQDDGGHYLLGSAIIEVGEGSNFSGAKEEDIGPLQLEDVGDWGGSLGLGLGYHIGFERYDNLPSLSTSESINAMCLERRLPSVLSFLTPKDHERPCAPPSGYIYMYESFFTKCGLWFPLPILLVKYCARRQIVISQLTTAAIRNISAILALAAELGRSIE